MPSDGTGGSVIYRDRHGRWWCRFERRGIRVWAQGSKASDAFVNAFSQAESLAFRGETGDFVVVGRFLKRRERGQNPHEVR
jgi:hypothetical protein